MLALMLHLPGMLESQIPCRLLASHGSFPNRPTSLQPFTTKASKTGALGALAIAADDFSVCFKGPLGKPGLPGMPGADGPPVSHPLPGLSLAQGLQG